MSFPNKGYFDNNKMAKGLFTRPILQLVNFSLLIFRVELFFL